jgi:hypothetical protein
VSWIVFCGRESHVEEPKAIVYFYASDPTECLGAEKATIWYPPVLPGT